MRMDPNARCSHGRKLWWGLGVGKAKHMSRSGNTHSSEVCEEASNDPEKYRDKRYIRD